MNLGVLVVVQSHNFSQGKIDVGLSKKIRVLDIKWQHASLSKDLVR